MTRTLADVVRVAGVLSFVAVATRGWVAVALMALVLLGHTLLRVAKLPAGLDLATGALLLAAAWWALLGSYERHPWLDAVVHLAATGLVAAAVHEALVRVRVLAPADPATGLRSAVGAVLTTLCLGLGLATLWEMGEWVGHTYLDSAIRTGYDDTVGDLATGGLGSLAAGVLLARRRRPEEAAPAGVGRLSDARDR